MDARQGRIIKINNGRHMVDRDSITLATWDNRTGCPYIGNSAFPLISMYGHRYKRRRTYRRAPYRRRAGFAGTRRR